MFNSRNAAKVADIVKGQTAGITVSVAWFCKSPK
jgi:hypothetical protein